jgi:hypothetical protein
MVEKKEFGNLRVEGTPYISFEWASVYTTASVRYRTDLLDSFSRQWHARSHPRDATETITPLMPLKAMNHWP